MLHQGYESQFIQQNIHVALKSLGTEAVCFRVEWLTDQSMVRVLSEGKHEILPASLTQNATCTHLKNCCFGSLLLTRLWPPIHSPPCIRSHSSESVVLDEHHSVLTNPPALQPCSSLQFICPSWLHRPGCSHPVGATADKLKHSYTTIRQHTLAKA